MLKSRKKVIMGILLLGLIIVSLVAGFKINDKNRIQKINENKISWKENAITFPKAGTLQPAGYITINWNSAEKIGKVKKYVVYADDKKIAETNGKTTTYEYYTTEVKLHKIYIEAQVEKGSKIYSDVIPFYVNKKGLCMNKDMARNVDAGNWGVSWYYNWSITKHNFTSFRDLQFVPMMWTTAPTDKQEISVLPKLGYKYVLAFNEPDLEEQSNISVEDAVEGMKAFMNQDIYVGSPATALCPPWSDDWFVPFMKQMKKEKMDVDFIPIHHYWNWWNEEGVLAFLDLVDKTWEMYHKPIWITEFAISGVPYRTKQMRQSVIDYMKGVIPELDKRDYVERYSWFSFNPTDYRNGGSALLDITTGEITDLGKLYQSLGMPEGYENSSKVKKEKNTQKDIVK